MAWLSLLLGHVLVSQASSNQVFGEGNPGSQQCGIDRKGGDIGQTDGTIADKRGKLESITAIVQKDCHEIDLGCSNRRLCGF